MVGGELRASLSDLSEQAIELSGGTERHRPERLPYGGAVCQARSRNARPLPARIAEAWSQTRSSTTTGISRSVRFWYSS